MNNGSTISMKNNASMNFGMGPECSLSVSIISHTPFTNSVPEPQICSSVKSDDSGFKICGSGTEFVNSESNFPTKSWGFT